MIPQHILDDLLPAEDGFFYYFPTGNGMLSSYQLRQIADKLDEMNKPWQDAIDKFFKEEGILADSEAVIVPDVNSWIVPTE